MLSRYIKTLRRFSNIKDSHIIELTDEVYIPKYKDILPQFYKLEHSDTVVGYATKEGTESYSQMRSEKDVHPQNFKVNYHNDLKISTLGLGTYQGVPDLNDDIKLFGSIIDSIQSGGVNHIDTAINYRYMKSERTVGAALRYLFQTKSISRDQVFIASKNGYVPADGDRSIHEEQFIHQLIEKKIVTSEDIIGNCHCMHPDFLEFQLHETLAHLGLQTLDLLYLHNVAEAQLPILKDEFYNRLAKAFEFLEQKVQEGKIRHYGLATWVCFRAKQEENNLYLSLERVLDIAKQVAGDKHHFHYVQLPINIMMPEAFTQQWHGITKDGVQENTEFLNAARILKTNVVSSQPLLNGALMQVPLSTSNLLCNNLGAKHLQFIRSIPSESLKTTLIGQKSNRHTKMNLEVISHRPLTPEEFRVALDPKKRSQTPDSELDVD